MPLVAVHFVYSTDCRAYQHWQSLLLSHSFVRVGQRGLLTRLVAGCADEAERQAARESTLSPASPFFHPGFEGNGSARYPQANRPLGLQYWRGPNFRRKTQARLNIRL